MKRTVREGVGEDTITEVQDGSCGQPATIAPASSSEEIQMADCIKGLSQYSTTALIW